MPDDPTITDELPQRHRAGAWVVLLMGIVGLGIGVMQWRGSFKTVFATTAERFKTPEQVEAERVEAMKSKDTDTDGLNDYEESYVYQTSPYLEDSDSDGADDRTELAAGDDPNCPKDKECGSYYAEFQGSATGTASVSGLEEQEKVIFEQLMNPTPDQIRQMLLQSGLDPSEIQGIDDATLIELYQQSLAEAQANIE